MKIGKLEAVLAFFQ